MGDRMPGGKPRRREPGKWKLWNFFSEEDAIQPYLPPMAIFSEHTLQSYIGMYQLVFVKPDYGRGGRGVIKIWRTQNGYAYIREKGATIRCKTVESLYRKIKQHLQPGKRYLIQEGIRLAKINGRPFDIRLMMMREYGRWKYIGMLAKVAGPNSAVTNIARGKGYVTGVRYALKKSLNLSEASLNALLEEMKELGFRTCRRFDEYNTTYWQVGLDLAVDKNGKLWIIEENTAPTQSLFARLKDKSMYRQIRRLNAIRKKRQQKR
ncbi:YheC/YheD family protein [Aneurinibacillus aneurinilyticus]|uniref:YheC/YheD family protein n=1 Tax=Aneurinibacillus aneurinilyticus TaxID=1391 RepID=UPI00352639A9